MLKQKSVHVCMSLYIGAQRRYTFPLGQTQHGPYSCRPVAGLGPRHHDRTASPFAMRERL